MSTMSNQDYWDIQTEKVLDYYRFWGNKNVPSPIMDGLTYQDITKLEEKCIGVPIDHPDFNKKMKEYNRRLYKNSQAK